MLFKDLKSGFPIYMYDNSTIEYKQAKVLDVSLPHIDTNNKYSSMAAMVVDVTVDIDGNKYTYTFKDNTETGYANSKIISTDKQNIIREIEASKVQSEEALQKVDYHKNIVDKCTVLLSEMDPSVKEKKQIDDRFNKLESYMSSIDAMLNKLLNTQNHDNILQKEIPQSAA